jgi:hypothetical protein
VKTEELNSWLSLGANIGVVIGLALLIYEINQNSALMEAQINQNRTDSALAEQQADFNSDYMPAIRVKVASGVELTAEELYRHSYWLRGFNRNMDNQLWQYNRGFLEENIPRSMRIAVRGVVGGSEIAMEFWDQYKLQFTDDYIAFVDEAIADLR